MKITKSHLKQFIREELEAALKEYVTDDPEAQKVLNHLNYQQRKALEQMMTMMGVEAAEFDELLRNPGKLAQFLELMQQASQVQVAEGVGTPPSPLLALGQDLASSGELRAMDAKALLNYLIERLYEENPEFAQGYDQGGEDLRDEEDRDWHGDESPYDAGY